MWHCGKNVSRSGVGVKDTDGSFPGERIPPEVAGQTPTRETITRVTQTTTQTTGGLAYAPPMRGFAPGGAGQFGGRRGGVGSGVSMPTMPSMPPISALKIPPTPETPIVRAPASAPEKPTTVSSAKDIADSILDHNQKLVQAMTTQLTPNPTPKAAVKQQSSLASKLTSGTAVKKKVSPPVVAAKKNPAKAKPSRKQGKITVAASP